MKMRRLLAIFVAFATIGTGLKAFAQADSWLPPTMPPYDSVAVIVDEPCCEGYRIFPVQKSADAAVLETIRDRAYRNGPILQLQLGGDRSLKIVDSTSVGETCEHFNGCRKHRLVAWWREHRHYVIEVRLWEGAEAYLISAHDGRVTPVKAPPLLSPSGRFAIAADLSPAYGTGVQIIDMRSNPPTILDVKTSPDCPGPKSQSGLRPDPRWLDETRIIFEGSSGLPSDPNAKQVLRIVDGKPDWEC
jgi:hypothetical protein